MRLRRLRLDRIVIEEARPDPVRLAAAIHEQLPSREGAVSVDYVDRIRNMLDLLWSPRKLTAADPSQWLSAPASLPTPLSHNPSSC